VPVFFYKQSAQTCKAFRLAAACVARRRLATHACAAARSARAASAAWGHFPTAAASGAYLQHKTIHVLFF
jgi:hypothetical protein